ncbi:MAG TPA: hypothetical protein VIF81_07775 [Pyrinomonadaceae bacterium]|jgi:hypothetical protein
MKINLHIERLVISGLPIARQQGPLIQRAVELELARLLSGSNSLDNSGGGATPVVRAPGFDVGSQVNPANLGRQIAESVYGSITR